MRHRIWVASVIHSFTYTHCWLQCVRFHVLIQSPKMNSCFSHSLSSALPICPPSFCDNAHTSWFGLYFFLFRRGESDPLTKIIFLSVHFLAVYVPITCRTKSSSPVRYAVTVVDHYDTIHTFEQDVECTSTNAYFWSLASTPTICFMYHSYWQCRPCRSSAVRRWLPTAAARVRVRTAFVVDKAGLGQVFSEYFDFPCQ
jgi:hypothetical protein